MPQTTHQFTLGDFSGTILHEGYVTLRPSSIFFTGASKGEINDTLKRYELNADGITLPVSVLLLQRGDDVILIDCGSGTGHVQYDLGHLLDSMKEVGVQASDVTHVIITHIHFDHSGGLLTQDGQITFPNASHFVTDGAYQLWTEDIFKTDPKAEEDAYSVKTRNALKKIQPTLFTPDAEILSGVHAIATPGHTANHVSIHVISDNQHLIATSDALVQPFYIEQPHWHPSWNVDGKQSETSLYRLLELAEEHQALMFCCHFDFPGLGHVEKAGDNWRWKARSN